MKITKLLALVMLASATQLPAMQSIEEEPISPEFNYFDKVASHIECLGGLFIIVSARHLPTMRTYQAHTSNSDQLIQGYYLEKDAKWEQRVALDNSSAQAVFNALIKISQDTPHTEKKPLLDQLHTLVKSGVQSQKGNLTHLTVN